MTSRGTLSRSRYFECSVSQCWSGLILTAVVSDVSPVLIAVVSNVGRVLTEVVSNAGQVLTAVVSNAGQVSIAVVSGVGQRCGSLVDREASLLFWLDGWSCDPMLTAEVLHHVCSGWIAGSVIPYSRQKCGVL